MNRKSLLIVAAILLLGSAAVLFVSMQGKTDQFPAYTEADLAKARSKMGYTAPIVPTQQAIEPSRRVRLAIGSMGLGEERDRNVSDLMLAQLSTAPSLEMVERQELETVLRELQLSLSGLVRAGDAVRVGKLLRADWFLLGTPAVVNGTNVAVIRAVDARTGIMRNAAMVPQTKNEEQLALDLAAFIRETRQDAAAPKQKTFLAIGTFQDLSVNNRHATLPADLRSQLIAAYQGSEITMLEREFVSALLKELYLDLAGLTEEGGTNAPAMQSAYWLVDGAYQSYETSQFEVEMVLNVRRMFGRNQRFELREKPGEPLFKRVKETINNAMRRDNSGLLLSRVSEFRAQLLAAQELMESVEKATYGRIGWTTFPGRFSEEEAARQGRNTKEAIHAIETALLLDPSNRQAKCLLARCLSTGFAGRFDEAREVYREVLDTPDNDRWTSEAKRELSLSFSLMGSPPEKLAWFESAARRSVDESARDFFREQARLGAEEVALQKTGTSGAEKVAEERLLSDIAKWEQDLNRGSYIVDFYNTGMGKYVDAFGTNKALAASKLVSLLPRLHKASTNLAPHILAGVVTFQVDTNAPVIGEFERSLDSLSQQSTLFKKEYYLHLLSSPVYRWAEKQRLYPLAARLKEAFFDYQTLNFTTDEDRLHLAYSLLKAERWQKALDIFQSYSNQPAMMGSSGSWGEAFTVVHPGKQAALCRQRLGLPVETDPREFELDKPCFHACSRDAYYNPLSFVAASEGLWTSLKGEVTHLGFDARTNSIIHVTPGDDLSINALCDGGSSIWAGTDGGGLFAIEKTTKKIRNFSEKDGLLMNRISGLHLVGDTLWIAYGDETRGAVGRLDVPSGRFMSFAPSLSMKPQVNQPPSRRITQVQGMASDEVFCLVASDLLRCKPSENTWAPIETGGQTTCYSLDDTNLFQGIRLRQVNVTIAPIPKVRSTNQQAGISMVMTDREANLLRKDLSTNGSNYRVSTSHVGLPAVGELETYNLADGKRRRLLGGGRLPGPPTAISRNGRDLWVGGMGFLALIDLDQDKIVKLAYIQARQVDSIQFGGGWVWVQFNKHLYRIPENLRTR